LPSCGTCRDIIKIGYNLKFINVIAISHGHYDHCGGLWSLLGIQRMLGRTTPLTCIYPKGAKEISILIDNFNLVYKDSLPYKINEIQVSRMDKTNIEFDFLEIISYPVKHHDSTLISGVGSKIPALGFKLKSLLSQTTIAYSGDTGPTKILFELFNDDIDLAIVEATHPNESWITDKLNRYHLTENEALNYSKSAKNVILVHKLPTHILNKKLI